MTILVVENEATSARLLQSILVRGGFRVTIALSGSEALSLLETGDFRVVITDWVMPEMDGIQLIREIRTRFNPSPLLMMATSVASSSAQTFALDSGADYYFRKPYQSDQIIAAVTSALAQQQQTTLELPQIPVASETPRDASRIQKRRCPSAFSAVGIAASTGGPVLLRDLLRRFPADTPACVFVTLHGPAWMLESMAVRLDQDLSLKVELATSGTTPRPGCAYIAPGEHHMVIGAGGRIFLNQGPMINFVRPAADPLFHSMAQAFGSACVAVILTGLGVDGARGAMEIHKRGGQVLVQNPESAVAPSMPRAALRGVPNAQSLSPDDIPRALSKAMRGSVTGVF